MSCEVVRYGDSVAILCGRPGSQRRICDICDGKASGPKDQLRDGTRFDACVTCRRRVQLAREGHRAGTLSETERSWLAQAAEKVHAAYAVAAAR